MTTISRTPGVSTAHSTHAAATSTATVASQTEGATATATAPAGWGPKSEAVQGPAATAAVSQAAATPREVATKFYEAFSKQDAQSMRALYAPNATFQDPIFDLNGRDATMKMWTGVFQKGKNSTISYDVVSSDATSATVKWKADYELGGRKVHNESTTTLTIKDGAITSQKDDWSWSKWAHQALPLGPLVDLPLVKRGIIALLRAL